MWSRSLPSVRDQPTLRGLGFTTDWAGPTLKYYACALRSVCVAYHSLLCVFLLVVSVWLEVRGASGTERPLEAEDEGEVCLAFDSRGRPRGVRSAAVVPQCCSTRCTVARDVEEQFESVQRSADSGRFRSIRRPVCLARAVFTRRDEARLQAASFNRRTHTYKHSCMMAFVFAC